MNFSMQLLIFSVSVTSLVAGCGGKPTDPLAAGRTFPHPAPPPGYPTTRDVPPDPVIAESSRQELLASLAASDAARRAHAIEGMRYVLAEQASKPIIAALADSAPPVRFAATMAIGELKLSDARAELLRIVDDPNPNVRIGVRFALHRIGISDFSHDLERTAHDADASVRFTTAMVLGRMEEPSAANILRIMRVDRNPAVRQQAGESLWRLGEERGRDDMIGLTASQHPDDQMFGLLGLACTHDVRIRQHVRAALTADYPEVTLVAARAMGMLDSDEGYGIALKGAESQDPRQRMLAAWAFGAIGRTDAQTVLRRLLKDSDADVRIAAATGILQIARRKSGPLLATTPA